MFGLGWTPCIGPTLGAVQTLAFNESSALRGALLSLFYCIGLGAPFLVFALFVDRSRLVRRFLQRFGRKVSVFGGLFLIAIGLLQVSGAWEELMIALRSTITSFVPVL
jgi:cytochrome c-type biogenesis protein